MLHEIHTTIATLAERIGPSVAGLGRGWASGSGVVVAPGRVLTVAHALRGEETTVTLAGRRADARVLGTALDRDLAVLEADTGDLPPVALAPADAATPGIGVPVVALADPGGRGLRATLGFVTTAARAVRGPKGRRIAGAIEHSAPLPRGSSGGPLVDVEGRLLGLNATRMEGGLLLALPAEADLVARLSGGEQVAPRRLGVALAPPRVSRRLRRAVGLPDRDGLLVTGVVDGSPAADAGLERGDLVVAAGHSPIAGFDDLYAALDASGAGPLSLTVMRGAEQIEVTIA